MWHHLRQFLKIKLSGVAFHFDQQTLQPSRMWNWSYKQRVTMWCNQNFLTYKQSTRTAITVSTTAYSRPLLEEAQSSTLPSHTAHCRAQYRRHTATNIADRFQCSVKQHLHNQCVHRISLHYMWGPQVVYSKKMCMHYFVDGLKGAVGTATRYGMDGSGIESG